MFLPEFRSLNLETLADPEPPLGKGDPHITWQGLAQRRATTMSGSGHGLPRQPPPIVTVVTLH